MTEPMITTVRVYGGEYGYEGFMPDRLIDAVEWLQGHLNSVPEEFRDTAEIDVSSYDLYDSCIVTMEISYRRPETEAERIGRDSCERYQAAVRANKERSERAELARLKEKYEGNAS